MEGWRNKKNIQFIEKNSKMTDINFTLLITLNINVISTQFKGSSCHNGFLKFQLCSVYERHIFYSITQQ